MQFREHQLRQKHQVHRALREYVGDDVKLRSHCPINGTTLWGQARPLSRAKRLDYLRRKERKKAKAEASPSEAGDGGQAMGSGRNQGKGKQRSSLGGARPTIVHPRTTVPQVACYHSWSIHDPKATAVPVDQHGRPAPAYTVPDHYYPPPVPTGAHEQHAVTAHYSDVHAQSQAQRGTTVALSSSPGAANHTYAATTPGTTLGLQIVNGSPFPASSLPSPATVWSENPDASPSPPSAHVASALDPIFSAPQDSGASEDQFTAVYQHFFVRRPIHNHNSSRPAPAPGLTECRNDTPQHVNGGPTPHWQAHQTASTFIDNTTSWTAGRYTRDLSQATEPATQLDSGDSIAWYAPSVVAAPIYRQGWEDIEMAANAGYAYTQQLQALLPSPVPEAAYAGMHPSPPTLSAYSDLARALQRPPHAFADDSASSSTHGSATTLRPVVSAAETRTAVYTDPSRGASSIDSLALPCPEDIPISEDECARIIQECFAKSDHLLSEISSLILDMDFAARQWGASVLSGQPQLSPTGHVDVAGTFF